MLFTIDCELDITDGFEPEALIGRIRFGDGQKSFHEEAVYLDSWLRALKKAEREMEAGCQRIAIDLVEEPQPLRVVRDPSGSVHIAFQDKEVAAVSVADFRQSVKQATDSFESRVRELSGGNYELPSEPE